jgi:hypothetical protein
MWQEYSMYQAEFSAGDQVLDEARRKAEQEMDIGMGAPLHDTCRAWGRALRKTHYVSMQVQA